MATAPDRLCDTTSSYHGQRWLSIGEIWDTVWEMRSEFGIYGAGTALKAAGRDRHGAKAPTTSDDSGLRGLLRTRHGGARGSTGRRRGRGAGVNSRP